jgi:myo-inositol-1(or 4)-monophosphatase
MARSGNEARALRPELESALLAVAAGLDVATRRTGADEIHAKDGVDLATGADIAAEDAMRRVLQERHPQLAIVGEERGGHAGDDGRAYWLIDPICGTRNYASHLPLYCTNLALVESGSVVLAVVGDGASGELLLAERGHGAFVRRADAVERTPIAVRDGSVIGFELAAKPPYRPAPGARDPASVLMALAATARYPRLLGTTLSFAKVATGDFAGLLLLGDWIDAAPDPLHTAAGCLLAEEAGALVTDGSGRPWSLETLTFIVAATPTLHAELLQLARG